jgi:hypothetical protein
VRDRGGSWTRVHPVFPPQSIGGCGGFGAAALAARSLLVGRRPGLRGSVRKSGSAVAEAPALPSRLGGPCLCGRYSTLDPLLPCAGSRTGAVRHGLRPVLRVCTAGPLAGRLDSRWLSRGSFSPQHIRRDRSSASALRPRLAPPFGFDHPFDGLIPTVPCGRRRNLPQRSRDSPFGACPRPDRYRFPGPCPLAVPWWRSKRPLRVRFKALIPGRSSSRSWIDLPELPWVFPLGPSRSPPWLTVRYPGPSSSALCVLPPCGLQHPAPWSLAQRRARLAVSGCQPSWVFRPCGHAGSSPRPPSNLSISQTPSNLLAFEFPQKRFYVTFDERYIQLFDCWLSELFPPAYGSPCCQTLPLVR